MGKCWASFTRAAPCVCRGPKTWASFVDAAEETLGQGREGRFRNDRRDCTCEACIAIVTYCKHVELCKKKTMRPRRPSFPVRGRNGSSSRGTNDGIYINFRRPARISGSALDPPPLAREASRGAAPEAPPGGVQRRPKKSAWTSVNYFLTIAQARRLIRKPD